MSGHYVLFWSNSSKYYQFSNFYGVDIWVDGKRYPSVEHWYQSHKWSPEHRAAFEVGGVLSKWKSLENMTAKSPDYWQRKNMIGVIAKTAVRNYAKVGLSKPTVRVGDETRTFDFWENALTSKFLHNKEIREMLDRIPKGRVLVEYCRRSRVDKPSVWGAKVQDGNLIGLNLMGKFIMRLKPKAGMAYISVQQKAQLDKTFGSDSDDEMSEEEEDDGCESTIGLPNNIYRTIRRIIQRRYPELDRYYDVRFVVVPCMPDTDVASGVLAGVARALSERKYHAVGELVIDVGGERIIGRSTEPNPEYTRSVVTTKDLRFPGDGGERGGVRVVMTHTLLGGCPAMCIRVRDGEADDWLVPVFTRRCQSGACGEMPHSARMPAVRFRPDDDRYETIRSRPAREDAAGLVIGDPHETDSTISTMLYDPNDSFSIAGLHVEFLDPPGGSTTMWTRRWRRLRSGPIRARAGSTLGDGPTALGTYAPRGVRSWAEQTWFPDGVTLRGGVPFGDAGTCDGASTTQPATSPPEPECGSGSGSDSEDDDPCGPEDAWERVGSLLPSSMVREPRRLLRSSHRRIADAFFDDDDALRVAPPKKTLGLAYEQWNNRGVYRSSVRTLCPEVYLDDAIVDNYLRYRYDSLPQPMHNAVCVVPTSLGTGDTTKRCEAHGTKLVSQMLRSEYPKPPARWILPLNIGQTHWVVADLDVSKGTAVLYDTVRRRQGGRTRELTRYVQEFVSAVIEGDVSFRWDIRAPNTTDIPDQTRNACGCNALSIASALLRLPHDVETPVLLAHECEHLGLPLQTILGDGLLARLSVLHEFWSHKYMQ